MAKKYYSTMRFETKEDFDKHFDSIYNSGYERGCEDGMAVAVSYMFEMLDHFSYNTQQKGAYINDDRKKQAAIANMKAGITPIVPDDPAIRENWKEFAKRVWGKSLVKQVEKEAEKAES